MCVRMKVLLFVLLLQLVTLSFAFQLNMKETTPSAPSSSSGGGFQKRTSVPRPKIITPSRGNVNANLEKFLMMYTCKTCTGRNAQMAIK